MTTRQIGLTGGIGSGKSTVAGFWVACGATLVDTDAIARSLTAPGGDAIAALRATFDDDMIADDGSLDRERMRARAFIDPAAKQKLEHILHPLIGAEAMRQAAASNGPIIVFDVPLLTESSHWRARCDRIVVVDCTEQAQVSRVVKRSGWPAQQVRSVIAQQASRAARNAIADAVIYNDDDVPLARVRAEAEALFSLWAPKRRS